MASRGLQLLKLSFLIGAFADAIVAANWVLIASGASVPNVMCGLLGSGVEYRFAMYISALFMAGWAMILAWGWFRPFERRGLLLITAVLLLVSIVLEVVFYRPLLDSWMLLDNSSSIPGLIAGQKGSELAIIDKALFAKISKEARQ